MGSDGHADIDSAWNWKDLVLRKYRNVCPNRLVVNRSIGWVPALDLSKACCLIDVVSIALKCGGRFETLTPTEAVCHQLTALPHLS
jgi:hypothetical protein